MRQMNCSATLLIASILSISACQSHSAQDDEQEEQDRAWGFNRDGKADGTGGSFGPNHFLVVHGAGNLTESNAYYASIIPNFQPKTFTLAQWQAAAIGNAPTFTSL